MPTTCATPWNELSLFTALPGAILSARSARRGARGRGDPVLVVPGFATNDAAMHLVHRHLRARGFRTYRWGLGLNLGPTGDLLRKLAGRVRSLSRRHGRPVHLVGWSMGGVLARVVAGRCRDEVARVVTLGSPLSGDRACSWLSGIVERCAGPLSGRRVRRLVVESARVPVTSIYSRRDGVVHWQACVEAAGEISTVEVDTTHVGMVLEPKVFDAVVRALR